MVYWITTNNQIYIDEHIPSNVNASYHTLQDLSTIDVSENDFSSFHMNTRSLSLQFDELISTLATLKIDFAVLGVSETCNSFENPIKTNVEIPGYSYFPCQSHSQNGGVAFYVKSGLSLTPSPDLGKGNADFETVWVEVENNKGKNHHFCCAYQHPNTNLENFSEYLQDILSSPAVSNKQTCILGDFNVNLLNYTSHTPTTTYVNFLFSKGRFTRSITQQIRIIFLSRKHVMVVFHHINTLPFASYFDSLALKFSL